MMELDPEARHLLELAREARTPSARDKARVGQLLAGALVGSTAAVAHAGSSGAAGKAAFAAGLSKWAGLVLVAVGGGVGYLQWHASKHPDPPRTPAVAAATVRASDEAAVASVHGNDEARAPAPVKEPDAPAVEPVAVAPATPPVLRRAVSGRGAEYAATRAPTLPEELDLLHEAQAAWRGGHARSALELLARHRATYPRSELGPERDALTVLCLCATGRTAQAQKLAQRFLRSAPRSPLRASVEESCGKDR